MQEPFFRVRQFCTHIFQIGVYKAVAVHVRVGVAKAIRRLACFTAETDRGCGVGQ
jgi:hypothetical protein